MQTGDQVVLEVGSKVDEVGRVTGHADDQVAILLGILLSGDQGFLVEHVELQVPELEVAPGADELDELFGTGFAFHGLGSELDVHEASGAVAVAVVLGLEVRHEDGGGAIHVSAVGSGRTVRQGEPVHAAVGGSGDHLTEGHVRGEGHVANVVVHAQFLVVLTGELDAHEVEFLTDGVNILVVVAVAGAALDHLLDGFVADPVGVDGFHEFSHGDALFFEHELLHSGEGVDHGAEAHEFVVAEFSAFGR